MTNGSNFDNDTELFTSLILNFQISAMIGMGKIVNPVTQKAERKLHEAKISIDMLNMLANKTSGNLTNEESRMLQQTLTDLRLNFVNEKAKPEPEQEQEEPAGAQTATKQSEQIKEKRKKRKKSRTQKKKSE